SCRSGGNRNAAVILSLSRELGEYPGGPRLDRANAAAREFSTSGLAIEEIALSSKRARYALPQRAHGVISGEHMTRREFVFGLTGVLALPLAARAQSRSMRILGFLSPGQPADSAVVIEVLRRGLKDSGLMEGHNVQIEFRWAEGNLDRLPQLAAELVSLQVSAIFAVTNAAALAAKSATTTIPIVFAIGGDPVALGLVPTIEKPGGNLTGISALTAGLDAKRVELLHQLVAQAKTIGMLVNQADPAASVQLKEANSATAKLALELESKNASDDAEIERA